MTTWTGPKISSRASRWSGGQSARRIGSTIVAAGGQLPRRSGRGRRREVEAAGEEALDDRLLPGGDQRAEVEVVDGAADAQAVVAGAHRLHDAVVDAALDEDARGGRAGLAGVLDAGVDEVGQRRVEVGVGEDELRRLAAELERHRHDVRRRGGRDLAADRDRAGEGEVVDAGVGGEGGAGLLAEARHDVEGARRQVGLLGEAGEGERGQARLLGGLQHAGVAGGEGACDRAPDDLHRVVPGDDVAGDAVRLAQGVDGVAGGDRGWSRPSACRRRRRRTRGSGRAPPRRRGPA